ncbi:hypothetical protein, partial [Oceanobacillus caeni]|uniref:hypothetical protein n=1 Tax=Oceanobacillus caeni TaxID=405946 RepID=UPI002E1A1E9F|nr:hypothetical protein [Oceanobacillus caeni]
MTHNVPSTYHEHILMEEGQWTKLSYIVDISYIFTNYYSKKSVLKPGISHSASRYQHSAPIYQYSAPRYQRSVPRYQRSAPRYQHSAPRYQRSIPRYQRS